VSQELYSVDQVAELLGLHVRTVRNYVRDGRLKAVRIGKQYRIAREDLEELTGQPPGAPASASTPDAEVSSIVQLEGLDVAQASRVVLGVTGSLNTRRGEGPPLRVETSYDEARGRLKLIVLGGLPDTAAVLSLIDQLMEGMT
jgi:excisionase family DNA binding protein